MKVSKNMWLTVLLGIKEREVASSRTEYAIRRLIDLTNIDIPNDITGLEFTDTPKLALLANRLVDINLEDNQKLKDLFFKIWKNTTPSLKANFFNGRVECGDDKQVMDAELKNYYLENMLKNPTIPELFRFRKSLPQESVKKGVLNIHAQQEFHMLYKTGLIRNKEDNWDRHLNSSDCKKLIDLIEIANLSKEEFEPLMVIGFNNKINQERFDNLSGKRTPGELIDIVEKTAYVLEIKLSKLAILENEKKKDAKIIEYAYQYMTEIVKCAANKNLKDIKTYLDEESLMTFTTYDKEDYEQAKENVANAKKWINENTAKIIDMATEIKKTRESHKIYEHAKEITEKIIIIEKYEKLLVKDENRITPKSLKI